MKAKDIAIKGVILELGDDRVFSKARRNAYKGDYIAINDFRDEKGEDYMRVCKNLDESRYQRAKRCSKRVKASVIKGEAYFVTLTFTDEVLDVTSEKTRRRYVSRAFKAIGTRYVANVDYGSQTEREHYHGIVEAKPTCLASWDNGTRHYVNVPDFREWIDKYGFVTIEKIGNSETDVKKVSKYTAKLSRHALKRSVSKGKGQPPRLIYSK